MLFIILYTNKLKVEEKYSIRWILPELLMHLMSFSVNSGRRIAGVFRIKVFLGAQWWLWLDWIWEVNRTVNYLTDWSIWRETKAPSRLELIRFLFKPPTLVCPFLITIISGSESRLHQACWRMWSNNYMLTLSHASNSTVTTDCCS